MAFCPAHAGLFEKRDPFGGLEPGRSEGVGVFLVLLARDLISGSVDAAGAIAAIVSTVAYAAAALSIASWIVLPKTPGTRQILPSYGPPVISASPAGTVNSCADTAARNF